MHWPFPHLSDQVSLPLPQLRLGKLDKPDRTCKPAALKTFGSTLTRAFSGTLVTVLALGALAGCSSSDETPSSITVYSGRSEELIGPLLEKFTEETGIEVEVRYADSPDLALLLNEEGDKTPADVFISASPGAMGYLDGNKLLKELPESILDQVPARFSAPDGTWVGISGRIRTLVYNKNEVKTGELPQSVFDLTDAKYKGKVGIAPTNSSFVDFVTAMREIEGDARTQKWLDGMKANGVKTYADNTSIVQAINRGEVTFGLVNHYYNEIAKAADPNVVSENFIFPNRDVGALILVTAAAVMSASDEVDPSEQLIDFLLTKESQTFLADDEFEYPLAAGVKPPLNLTPLDEIEAPTAKLSSLGDELADTKLMIQKSGLEG